MDNSNPLITLIVPVYKVEPYLKRCLDSIINQTYKNLEIILVDDGSPDNCGIICDEYASKDKRIKVIHKENGGLSSARNTGLDIAQGEYISFIDSDDTISIDMIEYLYKLLNKNDADISICLHTIVRGSKRWISYKKIKEGVITGKECIKKLLYNDGVDTSAWAKLYKRTLFNKIRYPNGKLFEDIATTYKLFIKATSIVLGKESKYNYILRDNSIVSSNFNEKKLELIEMTDKMGKEILRLYPDLEKAVLRRRVYARFSTLNQLLQCKNYISEKEKIINFIQDKFWCIVLDPKTEIRDKLAMLILRINLGCYKLVWENFGKK